MSLVDLLDRVFKINDRDSDLSTEIRAGVLSFLSMAHILVVNPILLASCGIQPETGMVATAVSAALATFIGGACGNLPFGFAPGLGLSAYVTYGLVRSGAYSLEDALLMCFLAGAVSLAVCLLSVSDRISSVVPSCVQVGVVVGIGLSLAFVALQNAQLAVLSPETLGQLGSLKSYVVWLSLAGVLMIATAQYHQVKGATILCLSVISCVAFFVEGSWPARLVQWPSFSDLPLFYFRWYHIGLSSVLPVLALMLVSILDVSGVMFGLGRVAGLVCGARQTVLGAKWGFAAAAIGTMCSSALGCGPIIIHVESQQAVSEGGRTGLCAVVTSVLFALSLPLAPLLSHFPALATTPVFLLVGAVMITEARNVDWDSTEQALAGFITIIIIAFTFSIHYAVLLGVLCFVVLWILTGQFQSFMPGLTKDDRNSDLIRPRHAFGRGLPSSLPLHDSPHHGPHVLYRDITSSPNLLLPRRDSPNRKRGVEYSPLDQYGYGTLENFDEFGFR